MSPPTERLVLRLGAFLAYVLTFAVLTFAGVRHSTWRSSIGLVGIAVYLLSLYVILVHADLVIDDWFDDFREANRSMLTGALFVTVASATAFGVGWLLAA